jgi:hypothetical protein
MILRLPAEPAAQPHSLLTSMATYSRISSQNPISQIWKIENSRTSLPVAFNQLYSVLNSRPSQDIYFFATPISLDYIYATELLQDERDRLACSN